MNIIRHHQHKQVIIHACLSVQWLKQLHSNKPLKFCLLFSHTHLTKAVKSMVGMVSVSWWLWTQRKCEAAQSRHTQITHTMFISMTFVMWSLLLSCFNERCSLRLLVGKQYTLTVMIYVFLSKASPGSGPAAVRRQRAGLLTGPHSGVHQCSAVEASRLPWVPGCARWVVSRINLSFTFILKWNLSANSSG